MNEQETADLVASVKAVTDRLTIVDAIIKSEKLGQPKVMAFRCTHSGLYYPAFYVKEWGKTVGIGLGESVVSETLDSLYHVAPPPVESIKDSNDFMHPMQVTMAQLDLVTVPEEEFKANQLILHRDDLRYDKRKVILRTNQINKKGSRIGAYVAQWNLLQGNGGVN